MFSNSSQPVYEYFWSEGKKTSIVILVTFGENTMIIIITLKSLFSLLPFSRLFYNRCQNISATYVCAICSEAAYMRLSRVLFFTKHFIKTGLFYSRSCINSIECSTFRISIQLFRIHSDNFHVCKKHHGKSFCTQYFEKKSGSVAQVGIEV